MNNLPRQHMSNENAGSKIKSVHFGDAPPAEQVKEPSRILACDSTGRPLGPSDPAPAEDTELALRPFPNGAPFLGSPHPDKSGRFIISDGSGRAVGIVQTAGHADFFCRGAYLLYNQLVAQSQHEQAEEMIAAKAKELNVDVEVLRAEINRQYRSLEADPNRDPLPLAELAFKNACEVFASHVPDPFTSSPTSTDLEGTRE